MLILLSPAKTLDFDTPAVTDHATTPDFIAEAKQLIGELRQRDEKAIAELMDLSDALARLNVERYAAWKPKHDARNSKQAVLAFNGDVYEGLNASELSATELEWAQQHVRILSGLYGVLKPLDRIQPYRLEMGTRLPTALGKNLYAFWGDKIARALNADLGTRKGKSRVVVNCASDEYFKAVSVDQLNAPVIQPVFEDWKGAWKVVSFHAKRARGLMARYAIDHRVSDPERLKAFDVEGYVFDESASNEHTWRFRRRET
ncbi:MAG TPA: peroxide stress protein YaaA [Burkholderiaceae bacterium]|nr:peroxide stress protein YaaA [Burkholderiaceae bacterium]